ncbi:MarR family winged helix-turn-helix transcriptional regulator [Parvularcula lutaonensis]|uniref:MarR family winged helix-turn-helix transcriptional regulator n=1 Tax=Parvularcula lutaonensis TaxID=491923 RepID=A0ABV7MDX1_9PROT|nr:MarR family winged helix-turn-helix transcriptional regulator [Parvularcula lutaonensis]GGY54088.1 hypothetical protein GCM10007148_24480 [Parvularcula lutaonensis]
MNDNVTRRTADKRTLLRATTRIYELDHNITLFQLQAFLYVANNEGCSQAQVQKFLGTSSAVSSRTVSRFFDKDYRGQKGFGFLRQERDPDDQRLRIISLTAEGRAFLRGLVDDLNYGD